MKFYFNPVSGKFQPLLFDAHKGAGQFNQFIFADLIISPEKILVAGYVNKAFYEAFSRTQSFSRNILKV